MAEEPIAVRQTKMKTKILLVGMTFVVAFAGGYVKGVNDQRLRHLAEEISADFSVLKNIDIGKISLARANLLAKAHGEINNYYALSRIPFLRKPENYDAKLGARVTTIAQYVAEAEAKMEKELAN